jgi:hypothetical protein
MRTAALYLQVSLCTFVPVKAALRISLSLLLMFSLVLGYAGVPVYRMFCGMEGRMVVSVVDLRESCHHRQKKSCCHQEKAVSKPTACCDYSHSVSRLNLEVQVPESAQVPAGCGFITSLISPPLPAFVTQASPITSSAPWLLRCCSGLDARTLLHSFQV